MPFLSAQLSSCHSPELQQINIVSITVLKYSLFLFKFFYNRPRLAEIMLEAVKKLSNGLKLLRPIGNDYCNDNLQEIHTHSHGSNELSIT